MSYHSNLDPIQGSTSLVTNTVNTSVVQPVEDTSTVVNKVVISNILQEEDSNLINAFQVNSTFDSTKDRIQLHVYSIDGGYIETYEDYLQYKIERQGSISPQVSSTLLIDPKQDLTTFGYLSGDVRFEYRFVSDLFTSNKKQPGTFFIESISPDRTEIRASSLLVLDSTILSSTTDLINRFTELPFVDTVKINFGQNSLFTVVNVGTQVEIEGRTFLLLKLYQPLPDEFNIKTQFTVEDEVSDIVSFELFVKLPVEREVFPRLKGPNFESEFLTEINSPGEFLSQEDILLSLTGQNFEALSLLNRTGAQISIDHNSFINFIHFSSATERLQNFKYKLEKIQQYEAEKSLVNYDNLAIPSGSTSLYDNLILGVIQNFDHYDRFLFFESGSNSWPKVNSDYPYENQLIDTFESTTFLENQLEEATFFDSNNPHRLISSIPTYLKDDQANAPYNLFIDMLGEFYDNLWIYAKAVTDRYDGDNRLKFGISRDLVAEALKSFGISLYGSHITFQNLFAIFTGETYVTGSEQINFLITGSDLPTSVDDYQKQVYKRLYHNIPILLKSKGTERGLRALINTFGIPKDTLTLRMYGGADSDNLPYFGMENSHTGSIERIRIDNTGSITSGDTLSYFTQIVNTEEKYTQDLHKLEVGFSPSNNINNFLLSGSTVSGSFDIDDFIGDPRQVYNPGYELLKKTTKEVFSGNILINEINQTFLVTVVNVGGINVYFLDGVEKPSLELIRGGVYTFDQSNATNTTHPLRFRVGGVGSASFTTGVVITGVPGQAGAKTVFTIPNNAPDSLQYYCTNHPAAMGNTISVTSHAITSRYNLYDFTRLLKFYDNTLFKMIKDFVPGRTVTSTGIIIKPHILERNKVKQVQPRWSTQDRLNLTNQSTLDYSNSSEEYEKNFSFFGNIDMVRISGKSGGVFSFEFNTGSFYSPTSKDEYDTRYDYEVRLPQGGSAILDSNDETKYNGEFGEIISNVNGVIKYKPQAIITTDGELNSQNVFKKTNLKPYFFLVRALRRQDPFFPTLDCSLEGFISCGCGLTGQITCN